MGRTRTPYPDEVRRDAVQLVRDHPERSIPQSASELGISDQSLRNWLRQPEIDRGARHGVSSDEREELRRLCRENRRLADMPRHVVNTCSGRKDHPGPPRGCGCRAHNQGGPG